MAKWVGIGIAVVLLAVGTAGYVLNNGAPAPPKGVCPALISAAPYDANLVAYADLTPLRSIDLSKQLQTLEQSPEAATYRDFLEKTHFHFDRDLDHILLAASTESQTGALLLEGRFDQQSISAYAGNFGTMKHYDAGDLYDFRTGTGMSAQSLSMMFLGPNRLAFAMGGDPHTEMLMLADSVKQPDPNLHAEMCERAERVAGASFFMLGEIPKSAAAQITPVVARQNPAAADILQNLRGWDMAYWMDGDSVRMAIEGQFDNPYDAIRARFGFEKVRESIEKEEVNLKSAARKTNPAAPIFDTLVKNMAISVDGRYVRIGSSLKKSDLQTLAKTATSTSQHGRM